MYAPYRNPTDCSEERKHTQRDKDTTQPGTAQHTTNGATHLLLTPEMTMMYW